MSANYGRLRQARENAGYRSARQAAKCMGINPTTYTAHENGQNGFKPDAAKLYGQFFGVSPNWLLGRSDEETVEVSHEYWKRDEVDHMNFVGLVEAGRPQNSDSVLVSNNKSIEMERHPRFREYEHKIFVMKGDSMELAGILDGDFIICVEFKDEFGFRVGEYVVVEQNIVNSKFFERILKKISKTDADGNVFLNSFSSKKSLDRTMVLRRGASEIDAPRIVALVVRILRNVI